MRVSVTVASAAVLTLIGTLVALPADAANAPAGSVTKPAALLATVAAPSPSPSASASKAPTPAKRPHPHKTLGPVAPKRAHPHRAPWPITVTINTVPTTPGLRFSFDGHLLTTNAKGRASFTAQHDFASHTLVALDTTVKTSDRQLAFARWSGQRDPDQAFDTTVTGLPLRANYAITAAFAVRQFVTPIFREVNGKPLDLSRVSSVTLKSDSSQVIAITPGMPLWLDSQRPVYQHSRLSIQPAVYSLQTVMVGGTNVVDVGRQTFKPATQASPTFITQFYDLTVTGYDALFHSPSGDSVVITFPDGSEHSYKLGAGHKVTVTDLPRGTYTVVLKAGRAIVSKDEFVLSKNKLDKIAVISSTDVAILALGVLLLALALLAAGRRAWANRLVRRFRKSIGQGPPMAAPFDEVLR